MKYWCTIFSQNEDLGIRANLCKNIFYPATIKNYNEAVAMRNSFVQRKRKHQLRQFFKRTT